MSLNLQLRITVQKESPLCHFTTHTHTNTHCPFPEDDDDVHGSDRSEGDKKKKHKSEGWVLPAWVGAFFVPEVSTLSIGQH